MNVSPIVAAASAANTKRPEQPEPQPEVALQAQPRQETVASQPTARNVEIDPGTGSVIFQTISESTGDVVSQYPSEVQLRVREYLASAQALSTSPAANSLIA